MKSSRFTDSQIMAALKQAEAGTPVPDLCREHGVSTATFYMWWAKFGGMDVSLIANMKALEEDVRRCADAGADCRRGPGKKVSRPSQRSEMAQQAVAKHGVAISLACMALNIRETCYRYEAKRRAENEEIANWLVRLTDNNRNWGVGLCYLYLRKVKRFG